MGKSTISMAIFNSYFDIARGDISPIIADSWMLLPFVSTIPQVLLCCPMLCFWFGIRSCTGSLALQDITRFLCTCSMWNHWKQILCTGVSENGCPQLILKSWLFVYSNMAIGFRTPWVSETGHGAQSAQSQSARYWGASELIGWVNWPGI